MLKKKLTLIIMCRCFFFRPGTFAQSKKKEKADKNAITAVDSKQLMPRKNLNLIKKLIVLQLLKKD
jgi:23S rRNA U2552 (ribose-2'-O)-methylase RlmE/FtsJ